MRKSCCLILLGVLAFGMDEPKKPARHEVTIKDMTFSPSTLQIAPGDSVVWTNTDDRDHTVSAIDGSFKSDTLQRGSTFVHAFKKPGTFGYACSLHPRMKGMIVVKSD